MQDQKSTFKLHLAAMFIHACAKHGILCSDVEYVNNNFDWFTYSIPFGNESMNFNVSTSELAIIISHSNSVYNNIFNKTNPIKNEKSI